ncbi:MAG: hypothetical protein HUJ31_03455, partial [Pseudomonadales bacterium]|nr:hypothetical protein [Pseudomonadales bacterium]
MNEHEQYLLDWADISWRDEKTPLSTRYGDIYWSGGLAEKQYVFLDGNDIGRRLTELDDGTMFVVGEIGFGFGLNFLLTVLTWRKYAGEGKRLHYVSIENHPVHPNRLAELYAFALAPSEQLSELEADIVNEYAQRLLMQYPLPTHGAHTVWLDRDIRLTLILDDAASLENSRMSVDAWYLDGLSPAL